MQNLGASSESCPFEFNFDPLSFKAGDLVSYRIAESFDDFPFIGTILAVYDDYIEISPNDPETPDKRMRATRVSRPVVSPEEVF